MQFYFAIKQPSHFLFAPLPTIRRLKEAKRPPSHSSLKTKKMKKIIVPIDFSKASLNAFLYAGYLAKAMGFSIQMVHVYQQDLNPKQPFLLKPGLNGEGLLLDGMQKFIDVLTEQESRGDQLIKTQVKKVAVYATNVADKILEIADREDAFMIVMGTKGSGNGLKNMLGSTAVNLAQNAECPVLLIPEGAVYRDFENVLYASNYESADEEMVEEIIDFGNTFRAALHFVHVEEKDSNEAVETVIFNKLFEKGDPAFSFNIVNVKNRSVMDGLTEYADEHEVDLIVLVNRQRSLLDNILQQSLTKKMARNTQLPLLIFHLLL